MDGEDQQRALVSLAARNANNDPLTAEERTALEGFCAYNAWKRTDPDTIAAIRNPTTRSEATLRLHRLPECAVSEAVSGLLHVHDESVQSSLARLLAAHSSASVPLLEGLCRRAQQLTRRAAVRLLGRIGDVKADRALVRLAEAGDRDVRRQAIRTLGLRRVRGAVGTLIELLEDYEWEMRRDAAVALGRIGLAEVSTDVSMLLEDEHVLVRRAALTALGNLGSPDTLSAVCRLLVDSDEGSRVRAETGVRKIVSAWPDAVAHLLSSPVDSARSLGAQLIAEGAVEVVPALEFAGGYLTPAELCSLTVRLIADMDAAQAAEMMFSIDAEHLWLVDVLEDCAQQLSSQELAELLQACQGDTLVSDRLGALAPAWSTMEEAIESGWEGWEHDATVREVSHWLGHE